MFALISIAVANFGFGSLWPLVRLVVLGLVARVCGFSVFMNQAREAARLCMANILSVVAAACDGDLGRMSQVIRITGHIRGNPEFGKQSDVISAASWVLTDLFGVRGRHARSAIGVDSFARWGGGGN